MKLLHKTLCADAQRTGILRCEETYRQQEPSVREAMTEHMPEFTSASSSFEGPRPARLEERDDLIAMINYVFRVSVGREPTIGTDWSHVYAPANLANVSVVVERNQNDARYKRA